MNPFIQLAQKLVNQSDEFINQFGIKDFADYASQLLKETRVDKVFNPEALFVDSFNFDFNPHQVYSSSQFSDLPITIAYGKNCFLDLYFWRRRPTVIHDHHFVGAFQCLEGNNIDYEFEFRPHKKIGLYHELGEINLKEKRRIVKGDVAKIDLLDKFIHQNHHQAELTINICLRTFDQGGAHLSHFLYSGLRIEKHPELLQRFDRLQNGLHLVDIPLHKMNLTSDDALYFLIQNHHSTSQSKKIFEAKEIMHSQLMNQHGLNVSLLMDQHVKIMDELENEYD